ncbi:MAG: extracellular solute-binding protein [Spirochaetota bacterium]
MFNKLIQGVRNYLGIIIIGLAFAAAAFLVYLNNHVDESNVYVSKPGDTIAAIAEAYGTTAGAICDENYPDISERFALAPGTRIKIPKGAEDKKTITISIAHWQLEPGVREGIDYMANEYRKLHPNVRVKQIAVPGQTYGQWFVTQMVGGSPADLMEIGNSVVAPLMVSYYQRYFVPMTEYANMPNPYNKGNEFERTPLRETVKDGLRACYVPELQEFMSIALTQVLVRMFYNRTLYRELTGRDTPPRDWREFLAVCEMIKRYRFLDAAAKKKMLRIDTGIADETAKPLSARSAGVLTALSNERALLLSTSPQYVPIANSQFHMGQAEWLLFNAITSKARDVIDYNHDCSISSVESYIGFRSGKIGLDYGPYRAKFAMAAAYASNSISGFTGLNRDDGVFLFVQQRAVFIPTGTFDAGMLEEQSKDNGFEIGVMDMPYARPDDPAFGQYVEGPIFDDAFSAFAFACPTPDSAPDRRKAAIDFLLFLAAKDNNIKFNAFIHWLPYINGAEGSGVLSNFKPHVNGVTSGFNLNIGGESFIKWQQCYSLYCGLASSFEKMRDDFQPFYIENGYKDYQKVISKNWRRNLLTDEKSISQLKAKAILLGGAGHTNDYWQKYRAVVSRPVTRSIELGQERSLMQRVAGGEPPASAYEYGASAKKRLGL